MSISGNHSSEVFLPAEKVFTEGEPSATKESTQSKDTWIGSPLSWLRQYWKNRLSNLLEARQSDTDPRPRQQTTANTFQLIDTLVELSEEVLHTNPDLAQNRDHFQTYLERTLAAQLEATLAESQALPVHTGYSELDLETFVVDGQLHFYHPGYRDKDLREYSQNAIPVAPTKAHKDRYQREHDQLDALYEHFWHELAQTKNQEIWTKTTAQASLSARTQRELNLPADQEIWLANKHALAMPRNKAVYSDGLAYLNTYQLAYLPQQDRVILLMDHLYRDYPLETHSAMLQWLESSDENQDPTARATIPTTEAEVMATIATLPSYMKSSPAFEVFCQLEEQFPLHPNSRATQNLELQNSPGLALRFEQQTKTAGLARQQKDIQQGASYLTQVLITEYLVCREFPEALAGLTQRLVAAREPVMNFLLQGTSFQADVLKKNYFDTYLSTWLPRLQTKLDALAPSNSLHTQLQTIQTKRDALETVDSIHQAKRDLAISQLAQTYPSILNQVSSQAQCAIGSFGGLTQATQLSNATSSLGQQLMSGEVLSQSQLAKVIGQERAQDWHKGICVNPNCTLKGKEQMVGECGLCYACEMAYNGVSSEANPATNSTNKFQDWLNTSFVDPMSAVRSSQEYWTINASDLPLYLWSGLR